MDLTGKVTIVTGAAADSGWPTRKNCPAGAAVVVNDIDRHRRIRGRGPPPAGRKACAVAAARKRRGRSWWTRDRGHGRPVLITNAGILRDRSCGR